MNIFTICGLALVSSILSLLLGRYKPEYKIILIVLAVCLVFGASVTYIRPLTQAVDELFKNAGTSFSMIKILYRCLGITYISGLTADICRDSGENALAQNIILIGKLTVIYAALPLITETIKIIGNLTSL